MWNLVLVLVYTLVSFHNPWKIYYTRYPVLVSVFYGTSGEFVLNPGTDEYWFCYTGISQTILRTPWLMFKPVSVVNQTTIQLILTKLAKVQAGLLTPISNEWSHLPTPTNWKSLQHHRLALLAPAWIELGTWQ